MRVRVGRNKTGMADGRAGLFMSKQLKSRGVQTNMYRIARPMKTRNREMKRRMNRFESLC